MRKASVSIDEKLLEILFDELNCKWLMIDPSPCRVYPQVADARDDNQDMG